MSAGATGAIGPVSVRYAAQIRELLHVQAVQRMAADQETARANAQAEQAAMVEAAAKAKDEKPLHAKVETPDPAPQPKPAPEKPEPAHIVDIQA